MAKKPLNFEETVNLFKDYKRYAETVQVSLERIAVSDFKDLYNNQYKAYRRQLYPNEKVPTFFYLAHVIGTRGLGHIRGKHFCLGNVRNRRRGQSEASDVAVGGNDASGAIPHQTRSRMAVDQHLTYKTKTPKTEKTASQVIIQKSSNEFICPICPVKCSSQHDIDEHLRGNRHRQRVAIMILKGKRTKLIEGSASIQISSDLRDDAGTFFIDNLQEKEKKSAELRITNKGSQNMQLHRCQILKTVGVFNLHDEHNVTKRAGRTVNIDPGQCYKIQVKCSSEDVGTFHCPVMFHFSLPGSDGVPTSCHMLRYLHARVTNSVVMETQPTSEYKHPPRSTRSDVQVEEFVCGTKPPNNTSDLLERKVELKGYPVPTKLRKMINRGLQGRDGLTEPEIEEMLQLRSVLESPLDMRTYQQRFDTLLHIEEVQMEVDIRQYDMDGVTMTRTKQNSNLLKLKVPGLAEGRPSVLRGDSLFVRVCEGNKRLSQMEYEGCVHDVELEEVSLGFGKKFLDMYVDKMKFHVRFRFSRLPIKLQHRAVQMASSKQLNGLLFPQSYDMRDWVPLDNELTFYDKNLGDNAEQRNAVEHIVSGTSLPAPYLVFGPPGTGKTVTIVEAMKQVWKKSPSNIILASAPSNSAADLIARRLLLHIPKKDIFRLNASCRNWSAIQDDVKEVCNYDRQSKQFFYPSKNELTKYRIIITTLVTAGRLVTAALPTNHFSHIFIDEAGHAVEPECIIAMAGLLTADVRGQVVIAGDPKQLGPILRSPLALNYKLGMSLLERLMESCDLYKPTTTENNHKAYNTHVITKLLKNYRSHPAILKLPNEMFYDSELITSADQLNREKLCTWENLPKKGFPLVFHSIMGKDMREEKSPSFFNPEEVSQVYNYVDLLLSPVYKRAGVVLKPTDLGVITPYRKQVQKIRQVLRKKYKDVMVGSVEEFQGQEKTVIIVSTVRSKPEYLSLDLSFKLGFLRNPKRFNVTVTRAKALLIVVGNPNSLSLDPNWRRLIEYCTENGGYRGKAWVTEDAAVDELTSKLSDMQIIDDNYQLIQSLFNDKSWQNNDDDED